MRLALVLFFALVAASPAVAGVIEQFPARDEGLIRYADEADSDDGFRVTELAGPDGPELLFERTTGKQPLRSLRPGCVAENDDRVLCRELAGIKSVHMNLVAGNDEVDASRVRTFTIVAASGYGKGRLTGGPLNDRLIDEDGDDIVSGGPGDDDIKTGGSRLYADDDTADGGPGKDIINTGEHNDLVLARDGEPDTVDCGPGERDVAEADAADVVRNCETVSLPAPADQPKPAPAPASPMPAPTPGPPAPAVPSPPPAESPRARDAQKLAGVVRITCHRGKLRVTTHRVGSFAPKRHQTTRLRRGLVRVTVVTSNGQRLVVRRRTSGC